MKIAENLHHWDCTLFHQIFTLNGKWLADRLFIFITKSADGYLYVFIGLMTAANPGLNTLTLLTSALLAFSIERPVYYLVKNNVKRIRPFEQLGVRNLIAPPDKFSFPSGHTSAAFLMVTLFSQIFPEISLLLYLWAFSVGFSRVYLVVHYPGDVAMGAILGICSAAMGVWLAIIFQSLV